MSKTEDSPRLAAATGPSTIAYLIIVLAMLSWGGTWITAKWASGYVPSVTAFWRFALTAVSFLPILWWRRESLALPRMAWPWIGLSALALSAYNLVFLGGLETGGGGYGGVLVPSLSPQFNFLIAMLFLEHKMNRWQVIGLSLGLAGGVLQILGPNLDWQSFLRPENLFFVAAAALYALLTHFGAVAQKQVSVFRYSFWLYLVASVAMLPVALWRGQPFALASLGADFWINVLNLSLVAGTFGTTVYFDAARRVGPARASSFGFLVPVSALVLAFAVLGEAPAWTSLVGGACSIGAVFLIQKKGRPKLSD